MSETVERHVELIRKAITIVARRLRNEDGNYNVEACWAVGILAVVAEMSLEDLEQASEVYSRVTFASCGDKKIAAIRIVRSHLECSLREGKDIVEGKSHVNAPAAVAKLIKEECERDCGATVNVQPWVDTAVPFTLGRGLDLSDDGDGPELTDDEIPF